MEKSSIKHSFAILCLALFVSTYQSYSSAKAARMSISEMKDIAQLVAIIEITASKKTLLTLPKSYPSARSNVIEHQARILHLIKGSIVEENIRFLHVNGLKAGNKYLVFLTRQKNKKFTVLNNAYGAFEISVISMKKGISEAARIPSSYISLATSIEFENGVTTKTETSSIKWVPLNVMTKFLTQ